MLNSFEFLYSSSNVNILWNSILLASVFGLLLVFKSFLNILILFDVLLKQVFCFICLVGDSKPRIGDKFVFYEVRGLGDFLELCKEDKS